MDNTDPRWDDQRITPSSGNVFVDLGFDPAEAAVMALRTELMVRIEMQLTDMTCELSRSGVQA